MQDSPNSLKVGNQMTQSMSTHISQDHLPTGERMKSKWSAEVFALG